MVGDPGDFPAKKIFNVRLAKKILENFLKARDFFSIRPV